VAHGDRPDPTVELFGAGATFHHVGLVVRSIERVAPPGTTIYDDPVQRVRVAFVDLHGVRLEYIEPVSDDSPVRSNLKQGNLLAHLCYEVPDMPAAMAAAEAAGFRIVAQPVPAVAFGGRAIAWVYGPVYGLVELLEAPS
jgi:methylmalonyl-CoA/ethylmalonyl-CoA epimerase